MKAKYKGRCAICKGTVIKGEEIEVVRTRYFTVAGKEVKSSFAHADCYKVRHGIMGAGES